MPKICLGEYGAEYLIDATGCYLTTETCKDHDIDQVIMSSPPKDKNTPTFIFGVNHLNYTGEKLFLHLLVPQIV